ncbi:LOW QUALITY PROTEIN: sugar transport integral membrane protein, partial [Streptomyces viridosporus ATCC 14672]
DPQDVAVPPDAERRGRRPRPVRHGDLGRVDRARARRLLQPQVPAGRCPAVADPAALAGAHGGVRHRVAPHPRPGHRRAEHLPGHPGPDRSPPVADQPRPGPAVGDPGRRLDRRAVHHGHPVRRPPGDPEGAVRGGLPGRRLGLAHLPLRHPAGAQAVITVVLVLGFMPTVEILDLILALTDGGPADATQTLGTLTHQNSFVELDFAAGAVVGNAPILVPAVFAVLHLRANRTEGK